MQVPSRDLRPTQGRKAETPEGGPMDKSDSESDTSEKAEQRVTDLCAEHETEVADRRFAAWQRRQAACRLVWNGNSH